MYETDNLAAKANNTRAARRATSPSLDVDRSLTNLPRAESPTVQRHSILADRATSGVQKRQKQKKMSRAQRLRQQKGMERAEAVFEKLETKKAKSVNRAKNIKARRVSATFNMRCGRYMLTPISRLIGKIRTRNRQSLQLSSKTTRSRTMTTTMLWLPRRLSNPRPPSMLLPQL